MRSRMLTIPIALAGMLATPASFAPAAEAAATAAELSWWHGGLSRVELKAQESPAPAPADLQPFAVRANLDLSAADSYAEQDTEVPTPLQAVTGALTVREGVYGFRVTGEAETVEYRFQPEKGFPEGLSILVNDRPLGPAEPLLSAAFTYEKGPGKSVEQQAGDETVSLAKLGEFVAPPFNHEKFRASLASATAEGQAGRFVYRQTSTADSAQSFELQVRLSLARGSLLAEVSCATPVLAQYLLDCHGGEAIFYEYYPGEYPQYYSAADAFLGLFPVLAETSAGQLPRNGGIYPPLTDGSRRTLHEVFCLTASRQAAALFPNTPFAASPFRQDLLNRVAVDIWEGRGSFAGHLEWLKRLKLYGLDSLLVMVHNWQNKGFDRSNPNMLPANSGMGGDQALAELSRGAQALGHRFNIHENYYDITPGNEDYRESFLARNPDGSFIPRAGGSHQFVKPIRHMEYVRKFSAEAQARYGCNSSFHDVMPHSNKVDYEASDPEAGYLRDVIRHELEYFTYVRQLYQGPVTTEMIDNRFCGAWDSGGNAYMDNQRNRKPLSAFEWLKMRPKTQNYGVGYYERWTPWGHRPGWERQMLTCRGFDRYRAMELAFGRIGFIGRQLNNMEHETAAVREYYLMRTVQQVVGQSPVKTLAYHVSRPEWTGWIDAAGAAKLEQFQRLRLTFQNGAELWVNYLPDAWDLQGLVLPGWGFVCRGANGFACTCVRTGQIVDYAELDAGQVYLDARSYVWLPPEPPRPLAPRLGEWRDLGGGRFELTIDWAPQRKLENNFRAFWEFKEADTAKSRPVFSNVHDAKTPPTSTWEPGQVYHDGPHQLTVSGECAEYDLIVGLTEPSGKVMRPMVYKTLSKVGVARLKVKRDAQGRIEALSFAPIPLDRDLPPGSNPEEFKTDMNVDQKPVDFGGLTTAGAAIIRQTEAGVEIIPVPLASPVQLRVEKGSRPFAAAAAGGAQIRVKTQAAQTVVDIPAGSETVRIAAAAK